MDFSQEEFTGHGFSVATLFQFVAHFARVRIQGSGRNRFALNGIIRDFLGEIFSGGIFSEGIFSGGILSRYRFHDY